MSESPHEPPFAAVRVQHAWDETAALRAIALELAPEQRALHRHPGQFVALRSDGHGEGFFALATRPDPAGRAELLVKRGAPLADAVVALAQPGATIGVRGPLGPGFPVDQARGRDVLLFAAGSGITPIRALIEELLARRSQHGRLVLYYGQRAPADFAYLGLLDEEGAWRRAGLEVILCCSDPPADWSGARGRVQEVALATAFGGFGLEGAVAFLSGMRAMIAGVRGVLAEAGLPVERTFLNY
jgi:NAD(P)H-flavin reductase